MHMSVYVITLACISTYAHEKYLLMLYDPRIKTFLAVNHVFTFHKAIFFFSFTF